MILDKKKYKNEEVLDIIDKLEKDYKVKISEFHNKIKELSDENKKLQVEVENLKEKDKLSLISLKNAAKSSIDAEKKLNLEYQLEIESLKNFSTRWQAYFDYLKEKYPYYDKVSQALELNDELKVIFGEKSSKKAVKNAEQLFVGKKPQKAKNEPIFDPKSKINDYINAVSVNGFNMDEVLNPGELRLEDLCKELGLTDDE